jgi:predicted XRE-type DNA-binding protein
MRNEKNRPTYITKGNVLDDLGFSRQHAATVKFKADLYHAIMRCARKYSAKELEYIFSEPQPRVSELMNGKIANKSVDKLLTYAGKLGIEARAKFPQTNKVVVKRRAAKAGA